MTTVLESLALAQSPDCLILTGNNRLRRSLLAQWETAQLKTGQTVWATPQVQPFRAWLLSLWQQNMGGVLCGWSAPEAGSLLLSNEQADRLWLQVVNADSETALINQAAAAKAAHSAWALLEQWQLRGREWPHFCSADMAAFQRWRHSVEQRLAKERWLDRAELPRLVQQMIIHSELPLPKRIFTLGVQHLAPSEQAVLAALEAKGVVLEVLPLAPDAQAEDALPQLFVAADPQDEYAQAAAWARAHIDAKPDVQLAIVLLNGAQQQNAMRSALMRALHPQRLWAPQATTEATRKPDQEALAFNFSLGEPLARQPIVFTALQLLHWLNQALPVETAAAVIQSPWLAGAGPEREARAKLTRLVLENDQPKCSLARVLHLASKAQLPCVLLTQQLEAAAEFWQTLRENSPDKARDWLTPLSQCLALAGWSKNVAGDVPLDSVNWQAVQSFNGVLDAVAELDLVIIKFAARDVVRAVQQAAENNVFQAQGSQAPLQVLGPLEAIGQQFDAVWVLGANDETLPAPVRPDPYIPKPWQRELAMPRASVAREQAWAQQMVQQLAASAPEVIFSYCAAEGETPYRPAHVLTDFPQVSTRYGDASQDWLKSLPKTAALESIDDAKAPAIAGDHPVKAPGGSRLFEDQSACAFRAFAHWRLRAKAIELPEWGMNAQELGIRLHRALEIFWQAHKTHTRLCELAPAELGLAVRSAISKAGELPLMGSEPALAGAMRDLEQAILHPLIMEWLALEKEREPFAVVGKELPLRVSIGRLRMDMQVDRIDELADGRVVITDYKTSRHLNVAAWNPPRMVQPQLPLYAVQLKNNDQNVAAVMFAQLSPGAVQPVGLTNDETLMNGLLLGDGDESEAKPGRYQPNLETLLPLWQDELQGLADDFAKGEAGVLPKDKNSCLYCDLKPLCRVDFAATSVSEVSA